MGLRNRINELNRQIDVTETETYGKDPRTEAILNRLEATIMGFDFLLTSMTALGIALPGIGDPAKPRRVFFFDEDQAMVITEKKGLIGQSQRLVRYGDITGYELLQDGQPVSDQDAPGGSRYCSSLVVRIKLTEHTLEGEHHSVIDIPFIITKTKIGGLLYRSNRSAADKMMECLAEGLSGGKKREEEQ